MAIGKALIGAAAMAIVSPVAVQAQDEGSIIVTGSRVDRSNYDQYYDDGQSAIGLTRKADYFVKPLYVSSDSRDATQREEELLTMLRATIERAPGAGIRLVAGDYTLKPVLLADIEELDITGGTGPTPAAC